MARILFIILILNYSMYSFTSLLIRNSITLSDLVLDSSGLFLILQLDNSYDIERYPNCDTILNENILNELSSQYGDPQCIWYSNKELHIFPAYDSNLNLNDIDSSLVESMNENLNPYIIIEAPTMTNPCFNLTVSVKQTLDNLGQSLKYQWFINNKTEWFIISNESQLMIPDLYLKLHNDQYMEIKLTCYNWLGISTTILHTVYIQGIEYCDCNLGSIYINQGNKQQLQPNWNNYPLSVNINIKHPDSFLIKWHQELTPNIINNKYQQLNFNNFKTQFSTNLIEWKYENINNDTILLPMFSTKHYNDYLFVVEVCDNNFNSLCCLQDYVFIRSKYPSPRSVIKTNQIEHINPYNPLSPSIYKFDIDTFFNFHPLYLEFYNNDFELIYQENEYEWTFECIGITSGGSRPPINCNRPLSLVGAFTKDSIKNKAINTLEMTAILTQSDNFISIYDLQQRQSLYINGKIMRSHTITFRIGSDQPTSVKIVHKMYMK